MPVLWLLLCFALFIWIALIPAAFLAVSWRRRSRRPFHLAPTGEQLAQGRASDGLRVRSRGLPVGDGMKGRDTLAGDR